ncbi:MAG: Proprotein convertase in/kexin type 6 [Frankiales bacterium]|nr:Proprotein convertase in/kexin type 6 [Frankiales bacterium]
MRLILAPVAALLLLPALPAAPALASSGSVHVTAVVRDSAGHLSFRHGLAADGAAGRQLAGRWRRDHTVVAASVDYRIHTTGTPDPLASEQWALTTLRAGEVGTATGQVVGVVDTGVDASHPDLAGVVLPGTDIVSGGDGWTDPNGHGTHVAGIVAAVADNGIGGAGLAQGAQILPVRVMAADGTGWDSDAAEGMVWAVDHGATVINLSFGGPDPSPVMDTAVKYALGKGVSVVVAAGNEGQAGNPVEWPAADPGVIAVGAVDSAGVRPGWSSSGSHLALVAPGVRITSTVPVSATDPSGYATWDGTSMAAPFVSAAAALLRHAQPTLSAAGVRKRLMDTADDLGPVGPDPDYGAGRVDVVAAEAATGPIDVSTTPAPVLTARISATRTTVPYAGAVTVSGRLLADGVGIAGVAVQLERQVGGSWVQTRSGPSGPGGLASWLLHPDATTYYRFVGTGWTSPLLRIVVTPVVTLTARTTGLTGRVVPGRITLVRIDVQRGAGWVTLVTVTTAPDGSYRLGRAFRAGTSVRAVALGVSSPTTKVA